MWDEAALILGAYLLGAFPLMYVLGRLNGVDLREYEDMHLALWRNVGRLEGLVGILFDFAKGAIVVVVARSIGFEIGWVAAAGVVAVVGQMWPVFLKFDGEKGNTTGIAMAGALATSAMLVALVPIVIGASVRTIPRLLRSNQTFNDRLRLGGPPSLSLPLGMATGFAVMPLAAWWLGYPREIVIALLVLFIVILVRRVTAGMSEDRGQPSDRMNRMLNRLLFDRSEI
jgi:glycerol-3-phosphate acyltransferase PlsY